LIGDAYVCLGLGACLGHSLLDGLSIVRVGESLRERINHPRDGLIDVSVVLGHELMNLHEPTDPPSAPDRLAGSGAERKEARSDILGVTGPPLWARAIVRERRGSLPR